MARRRSNQSTRTLARSARAWTGRMDCCRARFSLAGGGAPPKLANLAFAAATACCVVGTGNEPPRCRDAQAAAPSNAVHSAGPGTRTSHNRLRTRTRTLGGNACTHRAPPARVDAFTVGGTTLRHSAPAMRVERQAHSVMRKRAIAAHRARPWAPASAALDSCGATTRPRRQAARGDARECGQARMAAFTKRAPP